LQSNITGHDGLGEVAANILKAVHALLPAATRSAIFMWNQHSRKLVPAGSRHTGENGRFNFSKRAFESCLSRKQGLVLSASVAGQTGGNLIRVVLPVSHLGQILCLVHIESEHPGFCSNDQEMAALRYLLEHTAPTIDAITLRLDLDHYSVGMIEAMVATLEAKDTYTHGHSERVSRYSMAIADELNLNRDIRRLLLMSSLCHDIGKIGIPDAILRKAALLNPDEYEEMKQHPQIGANIVSHLPNARRFLGGIRHHHEKWDGTGYPDGLVGEEIPFFGRIVAVADVFDAMVSGRSYSGFIDESAAVEKMSAEKDLFDPDIIRAFARAWQSGRLTQKTSTHKNKIVPDSES
jgi:HD-GYP domain-containing protein (c-di-GMP phosphodiesterase class II)